MEIRPIFASLRKHRIPACLIVLEIALACAVLCNAVFMISQRVSDIHLGNAIDEQGITTVVLRGTDDKLVGSDIPRNLAALRGIAGVQAVAVASTLPLSHNNWGWSFGLDPDATISDKKSHNVSLYFVGEGADQALGLRLLQGRFFNGDEYAGSKFDTAPLPETHVVVITQSLAKKLWPGQSALGKTLYSMPHYYTVIGVVADVLRPAFGNQAGPYIYDSTYYPLSAGGSKGVLAYYVIRSAPQDRERILREAEQKLASLNPGAVSKAQTYSDIREKYFADMSSMAWMLVLVCVVMLAVTAFGIVGLTSFWVGQRRRQIGIRRAVGATRGHIMQYFQTENLLLTTAGVAIGMGLAFGINLYLMQHYEMSRMPWYYLPGGALALWLLGQASVFGPAQKAASVPPVVATRSV
ncbi:FtsX-like permease family protein [Rhodanobacter glycinis]|uniref:FtsX-like permease family protein n=1 Tax=Rhodanobacter glycinis TaxID=582702 RepID=A0A502C6M0_9GAMM|nr:FtsX-like permease family protein [Rhodanobacter glycinis]TPG08558.1 FtsX-like permease family protein [Rhodanobacter glycinis]